MARLTSQTAARSNRPRWIQPPRFVRMGFLVLLIVYGKDIRTQLLSVKRSLQSLNLAEVSLQSLNLTEVLEGQGNRTSAEIAFGELELFASIVPSRFSRDDNNTISGFEELQSTLLRSLQFFWPTKEYPLKINLLLDDTVCSTTQECNNMTQTVEGLFDASHGSHVKIHYNHLTNTSLYGCGYLIQQLIMLWADNFTDAKYIGFVDDDTLFTRSIQPNDLFDESGRPRAIVTPAAETMQRGHTLAWKTGAQFAFHWEPMINGMTYFPVVVERAMLAEMRRYILELNPQYSYFDEFYMAIIRRKNPDDLCWIHQFFSQFGLMMDFAYQSNQWRSRYQWHVETVNCEAHGFLPEECIPFPRLSVHAGYHWGLKKRIHARSKTPQGREALVTEYMKKGYCHSLSPQMIGANGSGSSQNDIVIHNNNRRCSQYNVSDLNWNGEWQFEQRSSVWRMDPTTNHQMILANADKVASRNPRREWDHKELAYIFKESEAEPSSLQ